MFDKSYFVMQALIVLGQPVNENGYDYSGDSKVGNQVFPVAIDELANKASLKMNKKKVSLTLDANKAYEFGMTPGSFNRLESWWILPNDFRSLINVNVPEYRISGDHLVTKEATNVQIEYIGELNPAEIPNNMRNLLIYILAKHIAIGTHKEEKLEFLESMIQNEIVQIKINTPNRLTSDYAYVKLRRR